MHSGIVNPFNRHDASFAEALEHKGLGDKA